MYLRKITIAAAVSLLCYQVVEAQVPENAPRPPADFKGRKAPAMTMEQAIAIARKGLETKGTPLRGRFVSGAQCILDSREVPHEAADFGKGPFWMITLRDPEYSGVDYPVAPIRVLVFADNRVAILAPE